MAKYKLIADQKGAFEEAPKGDYLSLSTNIPPYGKMECDADIIWMDTIRNSCAFAPRRHFGMLNRFPDERDYDAAFQDIKSLEDSHGNLEHLAQTHPFLLHRMGFFKSYGVRDITLFSHDGFIEVFSYDPTNGIRLTEKRKKISDGLTSALKLTMVQLIYESPTAAFFLHELGCEADFSRISRLYEQIQLHTAGDHLLARGIIPQEQIDNVRKLAYLEQMGNPYLLSQGNQKEQERRNGNGTRANMVRRMFSYQKEKDHAEYWVFFDGRFAGFNNKRAIPGYINRIKQAFPNATVLVHKIGAPLDFSLHEKLMSRDIGGDWLDRPERN
ncbi:hypothetical protein HYV84_01940 [Candidatus Woesearchaeota archaeon]|nr:hypothetical protein [Candidatus Woesearchaeota archaeon]